MSQMPTDACAECSEPFSRDYNTPTLCNRCWHLTPPEERGSYIKADRNTEQSVVAAKMRAKKQR